MNINFMTVTDSSKRQTAQWLFIDRTKLLSQKRKLIPTVGGKAKHKYIEPMTPTFENNANWLRSIVFCCGHLPLNLPISYSNISLAGDPMYHWSSANTEIIMWSNEFNQFKIIYFCNQNKTHQNKSVWKCYGIYCIHRRHKSCPRCRHWLHLKQWRCQNTLG